MKSVDFRELAGGLLVAVTGGAFALSARGLPVGGPGQIGPAYVPTAIGLIAIGLGLMIAGRGFFGPKPFAFPRPNIRPVIAIFTTVAVFALMIKSTGLVPTLFTCVIIAALGSTKTRPIPVLLLASGVALGCWIVFILALGLPIPAIRSPF